MTVQNVPNKSFTFDGPVAASDIDVWQIKSEEISDHNIKQLSLGSPVNIAVIQ